VIRCKECGRWVKRGVIHTHDLKALGVHLWTRHKLIMNNPIEECNRFFREVVL
jgi:hypothetical protein